MSYTNFPWWSLQWLKHLSIEEPENHSPKLCKIEEILVAPGILTAKVSSKRSRPYSVEVKNQTWGEKEWEKALHILSSEAGYEAALVNGELSEQVEAKLSFSDLKLFPGRSEWSALCTCKQKANPCEHIRSVYHDFVKLLNTDPLLLFELRGLGKSELMQKLRIIRSQRNADSQLLSSKLSGEDKEHSLILSDKPYDGLLSETDRPEFWTKDKTIHQILQPIYDKVSHQAKEILKLQQKKRGDA